MMKRLFNLTLALVLLGLILFPSSVRANLDFLVKPYVQLGSNPRTNKNDTYDLIFLSNSDSKEVKLFVKITTSKNKDNKWLPSTNLKIKPLGVFFNVNWYEYCFKLDNIPKDSIFQYKLIQADQVVFASKAKARSSGKSTFAVFGDLGFGSPGQKQLACTLYHKNVDFVLMPGDIVYRRGLLSEYLKNFFPVYNCDIIDPSMGAPLMRSIMFFPALGNHDMALTGGITTTDLSVHKDALGYFYFFDEPLNGPVLKSNPWLSVKGSASAKQAILAHSMHRFPGMANYSFDWGFAHILVLDANPYQDWSDKVLLDFVEKDLKKASTQPWKFVCYHQPAFSSDPFHHQENHMRKLTSIFQKYGVDVVFTGHAHCYQRSYPLIYNDEKSNTDVQKFKLDRDFDGKVKTKPNGIVYIVTGCGGAPLYNPRVFHDRVEDFTNIYLGDDYSFTLVDMDINRLIFKQISSNDKVIDEFSITK